MDLGASAIKVNGPEILAILKSVDDDLENVGAPPP